MGKRDFRHRETKKPKKTAKQIAVTDILSPPVTVKVIKKKRKEPKEEA